MSQAALSLIVPALMCAAFLTRIVHLYVTALSGAVALGLLGIFPAGQIFSGLSNPTLVLFAGMFVLGAALFQTGLAQATGAFVVRRAGGSGTRLLWGSMIIAGAASCSFLTPVGTPPNALVLEPGRYRFSDYPKVGLGLTLVCLLVALTVIPWIWPVYP